MGGTPFCPSIIARNIATLIVLDLHPLVGPETWPGNPISIALTNAILIRSDIDVCPATK